MSKILRLVLVLGLIFIGGEVSTNKAGSETDEPLFDGEDYVLDEIVVKFKPGVTATAKGGIHRRFGAISQKDCYGGIYQVIKIKKGMVGKMVDLYCVHPLVEYAEPNYIFRTCFTPNDPSFHLQFL